MNSTVTSTMPTLVKMRRKPKGKDTQISAIWGIRYYCRIRGRSWVISTQCRKRRNAERRLTEFTDLLERGQVGRDNPFKNCREDREQQREEHADLSACLVAFEADLRAGRLRHGKIKPVSAAYATTAMTRLRRVIDACEVARADALTVEKIHIACDKLQKDGQIESVRTRRHHETIVRTFGTWLLSSGRLDRNPLASLKVSFVGKEDEVHNRKAFTLAQLNAIVKAACEGDRCFKLTGSQRAYLFLMAAYTGLRARECAAIRKCDFAEGMTHVSVAGNFTKNDQDAVQPIPSFLRPMLTSFVKNLAPDAFLWPGGWIKNGEGKWTESGWVKRREAGKMLRHDAAKVGIVIGREGRDANGGAVLDFHSLRHFYSTECDRAGISDGLRLKLSRASSQSLLERYTHRELHELGAAVECLPVVDWPSERGEKEAG